MIIVDENIHGAILLSLQENGFEVFSIINECSGIDDFEIILKAQGENRIILTEDKDFGEWVFAHHIKNISVVFLRYHHKETDEMKNIVVDLFSKNKNQLYNKFTTVTTKKIRSREI